MNHYINSVERYILKNYLIFRQDTEDSVLSDTCKLGEKAKLTELKS